MDSNNTRLQRLQTLYLNPKDADVWFVFKGERIPSHKLILMTMSDYYETMFYGPLPVTGEINMNEANISAESFKEFLKYVYFIKPNLTMDNIEGVINMAKTSHLDEIVMDCENFLKSSLTKDNLFFEYQLALLHGMSGLKSLCDDEICVHIESIFKSKRFLEMPYVILQEILKNDSLACEEINVFDACIAWGKAACQRNGLNPSNMEHLRSQLVDSVYQIRFTSMKDEDATACIESFSGLFTAAELQEINCMVEKKDAKKLKKFNWTPRYFNLEWRNTHRLECSRLNAEYKGNAEVAVYKTKPAVTTFTCSRRVILTGFKLELSTQTSELVHVQIKGKTPEGYSIECYDDKLIAHFIESHSSVCGSFLAEIQLKKWTLIQPNYTYEISVTFEDQIVIKESFCSFQQNVCVDYDVIFDFKNSRGIVASLSFRRVDNPIQFRKIIRSLKVKEPEAKKKLMLRVFVIFTSIYAISQIQDYHFFFICFWLLIIIWMLYGICSICSISIWSIPKLFKRSY